MALWQLILTELRQFWREPGALFWTLVFPLGLAGALGLGFSNRSEPIYVIAIEVGEMPPLLQSLYQLPREGQPQFAIRQMSAEAAMTALKRGEILLLVAKDSSGDFTFRFDPANSEARQAFNALENMILRQTATTPPLTIAPVTTQGYRYIDFLIPGLLAMSIMNSCIWGIGWTLVEYRVKKLLRRIAATPMRKTDFLLAQMITRLLLLMLELGLMIGFAYSFFGVVLQGSWAAFALIVLAGTWAFSGLAFLMSSRTAKTSIANGLINAITLPMTVVSGIFFSYQGFPEPLVSLIKWLPLTLLADYLRSIFNEGYGLAQVALPATVLFVLGSILFTLALRIYKWQ
ncbi:ABC transporter permease [Rhodoflexus sp.]